MRTKVLLATTLVVPLLVVGCGRDEPAPTASTESQERQARAPMPETSPQSPDSVTRSSPPGAGIPPEAAVPPANPPSAAPSPDDTAGERRANETPRSSG